MHLSRTMSQSAWQDEKNNTEKNPRFQEALNLFFLSLCLLPSALFRTGCWASSCRSVRLGTLSSSGVSSCRSVSWSLGLTSCMKMNTPSSSPPITTRHPTWQQSLRLHTTDYGLKTASWWAKCTPSNLHSYRLHISGFLCKCLFQGSSPHWLLLVIFVKIHNLNNLKWSGQYTVITNIMTLTGQ